MIRMHQNKIYERNKNNHAGKGDEGPADMYMYTVGIESDTTVGMEGGSLASTCTTYAFHSTTQILSHNDISLLITFSSVSSTK